MSEAEILGRVWDQAFDGDANVVEVYIGHLRRRLTSSGCTASRRSVASDIASVEPEAMTWTRLSVRGRITSSSHDRGRGGPGPDRGRLHRLVAERDLLRRMNTSAHSRAQDIMTLSSGTLPSVLPAAPDDGGIVQVLDSTGAVVSGERERRGRARWYDPDQPHQGLRSARCPRCNQHGQRFGAEGDGRNQDAAANDRRRPVFAPVDERSRAPAPAVRSPACGTVADRAWSPWLGWAARWPP